MGDLAIRMTQTAGELCQVDDIFGEKLEDLIGGLPMVQTCQLRSASHCTTKKGVNDIGHPPKAAFKTF